MYEWNIFFTLFLSDLRNLRIVHLFALKYLEQILFLPHNFSVFGDKIVFVHTQFKKEINAFILKQFDINPISMLVAFSACLIRVISL